MAKKDTQLLLRLSKNLKEQLDERAEKMGIGTSTMIRMELIKILKEKDED